MIDRAGIAGLVAHDHSLESCCPPALRCLARHAAREPRPGEARRSPPADQISLPEVRRGRTAPGAVAGVEA